MEVEVAEVLQEETKEVLLVKHQCIGGGKGWRRRWSETKGGRMDGVVVVEEDVEVS